MLPGTVRTRWHERDSDEHTTGVHDVNLTR